MAGEIISEHRARSNRNGGRHHRGFAGDFPRNPQAARSNWAFLASAAVLRRSTKLVFLDWFISTFWLHVKRLLAQGTMVQIGAGNAIFQGKGETKIERPRACRGGPFEVHRCALSDEPMSFVGHAGAPVVSMPAAHCLQARPLLCPLMVLVDDFYPFPFRYARTLRHPHYRRRQGQASRRTRCR